MVPRSRRFRIAGIFDSGFYDYDANWGFVTLSAVQNLAGVGDVVSELEFRIADVDRAEEMAKRLLRRSGSGLRVDDLDGRKSRAFSGFARWRS